MRSLPVWVVLVLVANEEYRSFVARGSSDDLSRALGALQRRRRWLEAGLSPADLDNLRHQYGTVTHYPSAKKKSSSPYLGGGGGSAYDSIASVPPEDLWRSHLVRDDDGDDDGDKAMAAAMMMKKRKKKSAFREREHMLEEEENRRRRRKRLPLLRKRQEATHWGDTEDELKAMARRRFLDAILPESRSGNVNSEFLDDLREEDIAALVDLLWKDLANTLDKQRYMEGEGQVPHDDDNDDDDDDDNDLDRKRRMLAVRKRLMWQDGFRQALGDNTALLDKRTAGGELVGDGWQGFSSSSEEGQYDSNDDDDDDDYPKLPQAYPRMRMLMNDEGDSGRFDESDEDDALDDSDEASDFRKREVDPWYAAAYDVRKRSRNHLWSAYVPTSPLYKRLVPLKRKRTGSAFRERTTHDPGVLAYVGTSKRSVASSSAASKRSPEEPVAVTKRMAARKATDPHVLDELQSLMADDDDDHTDRKRVAKRDDGQRNEASFEEDDAVATLPSMDDLDSNELSEEKLNQLMLDDDSDDNNDKKRTVSKKKKRSWDDYFGMDKRAAVKKDSANASSSSSESKNNDSNASLQDDGSLHNLNEWMMNRYFKSMAAAMSSKRKRTPEDEEDDDDDDHDDDDDDKRRKKKRKREQDDDVGSGHHPLLAMDRRLEAIENFMLEEALGMVEGRGAGDGDRTKNAEEQREKIVHRLDAAHSLEKMRKALADFEHTLDRIHDDEESDHGDDDDNEEDNGRNEEDKRKKKKKKKADPENQNLVEALHVMAPQSTKRTSLDDADNELTDGKSECPVFTEIAMLCTELSKAAGDSQRSLVGACGRHIMCYACDYAYEKGPRIPCDLIFMREAHEICADNVYCRSTAAQMHGVLRERVPAMRKSQADVCLSAACVKAYRRR